MDDFDNFNENDTKKSQDDDLDIESGDDEESIVSIDDDKLLDDDEQDIDVIDDDDDIDIIDDDEQDDNIDDELNNTEYNENNENNENNELLDYDDRSVSSIDSDESDISEDDSYFQKFDSQMTSNIIEDYHHESKQINYDEVNTLSQIIKDKNGKIIDPFHKTLPILSKFEKTRILGIRAKQINEGAKPFVEMNQNNYDGYVVACQELTQKKIPFIIRRPLPSGVSEYWKLQDLEVLG